MYNVIAVISDIHSNRLALEAVLQDLESRNANLIVNLGDTLFGPIDPLGTAALLMEQPAIVNIMGNCDEILLQERSESLSYKQVKPLLSIAQEEWISSFRGTWSYEELLFCHGTPWNNGRYLLEQVQPDGTVVYKQPEALAAELQGIAERIIFCGHSHVFQSIDLPGGKKAVNAGSVGLPAYEDEEPYPHVMESGTRFASYCLCRRTGEPNNWAVQHRLVEYNWEAAAAMADSKGRHDYAVAIRNGRMSRE
ncbi:metallophosphoesterase family protein [Paenibacillus pedocola]|uniref:metallophosphoesterase family protein n=1 Tax=Paenibacillus pedocola TaxID=3242193 RepID=UPI0028779A28|nr:metallophosphoesterase family protein [Paenibacillus typhae]